MSTTDPWVGLQQKLVQKTNTPIQGILQTYGNTYTSAPIITTSTATSTINVTSGTFTVNGNVPLTYYGIPDKNVGTSFTYDYKPQLIVKLNTKFDGFTFYINKAGTVSIDNGTDRVIRTDIELVSEYYTETEYFDNLLEEIKELIAQ